jgi:response regulator RpfG family c-di-GMP phosphodiesterase
VALEEVFLGLNLAGPGRPNAAKESPAEGEVRVSVEASRPVRILVVDDEAHVRSMLGSTLERNGYEVQLASSGREALEALALNTYDLVLTDIVMQDLNGITLLERVHAQQPNLPVVMVTAIHDISVAIDSMRRGAYDYLLKPFERDHLLSTVERALKHRQLLEDSQNYQQSLEQMVRARTEMLRHAMEDLEHSYDVTLEALGDALDLKDSETEGHSKRVTAYTIALARAMGLAPAEIRGLAGREIPIGARIFSIADALDAITSDRTYRKARSFDTAREEILRCSGTQFDPTVVEAFLKIPNELWQELRSEISGQNKRYSTFEMTPSPSTPDLIG